MNTITVDTAVDELDGSIFDGDISLRDALAAASAGDVIQFDTSVFVPTSNAFFNQTISMDPTLGTMEISVDLLIDGDVNGDGIADVTIDGVGQTGIFRIDNANVDAVFNGLYLTRGNSLGGGAILATGTNATLFVSNSNFLDNASFINGGAILTTVETTIVNSFFGDNSAGLRGGAVHATSEISIVNSTFRLNSANTGGAIDTSVNTLNLVNSTLSGNLGASGGGGISGTVLNISNSIVLGNLSLGSSDDIAATALTSNGHNIFGNAVGGSAPGDQLVGVAGLPNVFENVGPVTVDGTTFDAGRQTSFTGITPVIGITSGGLASDAGDNAAIPSEATLGFDVDRDGTIEATPLSLDASGFNRIVDGTVDIGASENFNGIWLVDTTSDVDDGILTSGNLSLREAFRLAGPNDTITFDPTVFTADDDELSNATIALTNGSLDLISGREISINGDVNGDGIADVTLDGASNSSRAFYGASGSTLNLSSLTIQNFDSTGGSAIFTYGNTDILNSTIANNQSTGSGGAILARGSGALIVANSTFKNNTGGIGGAIYARSSQVSGIFNSTFTGNHSNAVSGLSGGGAIEGGVGALIILNSTFTRNTTDGVGGAINVGSGTLEIKNSIAVGNIERAGGTASIVNDVSSASSGTSNGRNVFGVSDVVAAGDVISASALSVFDAISISINDGIAVGGGRLSSNGGPTDTVLIKQGGPAVDQGNSADVPSEQDLGLDVDGDGTTSGAIIEIDQRGSVREAGVSVDAGAVELNTGLVVVTTTEDTRDGDLTADDISWREALDLVSDGGTITFDDAVFAIDDDPLSNTVINVLSAGEANVSKNLRIDGDLNDDGIADVTFDGDLSNDQFLQTSNSTSQHTIEGITVQNFSDNLSGGAIQSNTNLFILNSNFVDNESANFGGAIRLYNGSALIANSYFGGNSSANDGGAIAATANTTIIGSTFHRNHAETGRDGGAIHVLESTNIINSTITGNYAATDGGGVHQEVGTLSIFNSIIAGNSAGPGGPDDVAGTFTSNGSNVFGYSQAGAAPGDVVLTTPLSNVFDETATISVGGADAFIAGIAADNGGTGPTVALKATNAANPALDAGDPDALNESALGLDLNFDGDTLDIVTFDGRGFARSIDLPGIGTSVPDIGAFEVQTVPTIGADLLIGDAGSNQLNGLGGGDSIDGASGNDTIVGGDGADLIAGGAGADSLDGGAGIDTADYSSSASTVIVRLDGTAGIGGDAAGDTLTNVENLIGSSNRDFLIGDGNVNTLMGGDSADNLQGGPGADVLDGGAGFDFADYQEVTTTLTIDLITFTNSSTVIQEDTLINMEAYAGAVNAQNIYNGRTGPGDAGNEYFIAGILGDTIDGNDGADTLRSEAGNDTVNGGAGSDFLVGGLGDDTLSGGGADGAVDGFLFQDGHGNDVVTDFELGFDKLSWFSPTINALGDLALSTSGNGFALVTYGTSTVEVLNVTEAQLNDMDNFFFF